MNTCAYNNSHCIGMKYALVDRYLLFTKQANDLYLNYNRTGSNPFFYVDHLSATSVCTHPI